MSKTKSLLCAVAALLGALPAQAWDREVHVAIAQAARLLSPAAAARFPDGYIETVLKAAGDADSSDLVCTRHRNGDEKDASKRAVQRLEEIRNPKAHRTPHQEAVLLGEYLHYVADCETPRVTLGVAASNLLIGAYDIAVFRDARPVTPSLAEYLTQREAESLWADPVEESASYAFREAVNATVDALLLLPPVAGMNANARDEGPTLFSIVNVVPPIVGLASSADAAHEKWANTLVDLAMPYCPKLAERGIHVLEWVPHTSEGKPRARVLLFNNQGVCARDIRVQGGNFQVSLSATVPPFSLKVVEIEAPPISPDDLHVASLRGVCDREVGPKAFPARWDVVWMTGKPDPKGDRVNRRWLPTFVEGREVRVPLPAKTGRAFDVAYDPEASAKALKGLWITYFVARDEKTAWTFDIESQIDLRGQWTPRPMLLEVEATNRKGGKERYELRLVPDDSTRKPTFKVQKFEQDGTARFASPRFRLVSAKREGDDAP